MFPRKTNAILWNENYKTVDLKEKRNSSMLKSFPNTTTTKQQQNNNNNKKPTESFSLEEYAFSKPKNR